MSLFKKQCSIFCLNHFCLLFWDFNLTIIDLRLDIPRALSIDGASDRKACSQNFLNGSRQLSGHTSFPHGTGNLDDGIQSQVSVVDNVFDLLTVTDGLVKGLHDKRRGGGDKTDGGLTVNNSKLNSDVQSFPVHGGLLDVFSNFLRGKTERTNLRSEGGSRSDFPADRTHDYCNTIVSTKYERVESVSKNQVEQVRNEDFADTRESSPIQSKPYRS